MSAPTYYPEWAIEDTTLPQTSKSNKVRPKESLRNIGWDKGQIPSAEEMNWLLNNYYLWLKYVVEEALPTYLPITGTELDFTGNITGTATWSGSEVTSVVLASDLDSSTSSATASTLVKRDSSGGASFVDITAEDLVATGTSTLATVDINGGAIDNTTIGAATPSTGSFSSLTATTADINAGTIDATSVGATTRSSGAFTTLAANGATTLSGAITSTGTNSFSGSNTFSTKLNLQSSSVATNGYTYLPNGLIMQWGWVASGDDSYIQINLPLPFPNNCFNVSATPDYNSPVTNQGTLSAHAHIDSKSVIHVGVSSPNSDVPNILGVFWQAIGN